MTPAFLRVVLMETRGRKLERCWTRKKSSLLRNVGGTIIVDSCYKLSELENGKETPEVWIGKTILVWQRD